MRPCATAADQLPSRLPEGGAAYVRYGPGSADTTGCRDRTADQAPYGTVRHRTRLRTGLTDSGGGMCLLFVFKGAICVVGGGTLMGRARAKPSNDPQLVCRVRKGQGGQNTPTSDLPSGNNFLTLKKSGLRTSTVRAPYGHGRRIGLLAGHCTDAAPTPQGHSTTARLGKPKFVESRVVSDEAQTLWSPRCMLQKNAH
jgi:hypothetical protein